jgi:LysR family glycine cleavage system transcriptional activator
MPYRSLPSLPSLRAFECVARHGSFKEASKELFVTPGALSQLVKKLEEELDRELFVRGHRNIQLTEDGKTLIVGLQRGFSLLKESVDTLRAKKKDVLNVAAPPPIMSQFIIPKLNNFLASHPNLDVHFSMDYEEVNYWERDIDVGIRLCGDSDSSMCVTSLSKERYVIAASPSLISQYDLHISANIARAPLIEAVHVQNAGIPSSMCD